MSKVALGITAFLNLALSAVYSFPLFSPPSRFLLSLKATSEETCPQQSTATKDFDTILRSRRTISSFEPALPHGWEEIIQRAIESAIHAPNHKRTEPWRFHLLGPKTAQRVCELNAAIVTEKKGAKAGERKLERWLTMPGWLVVTCVSDNVSGEGSTMESMDKPSGRAREDYAACCCAVQNLCLSLHAAGLGTKWGTGGVNFDPRFSDIVGLSANEYVVGTIWFGNPQKIPEVPPKKRSLEHVLVRHD